MDGANGFVYRVAAAVAVSTFVRSFAKTKTILQMLTPYYLGSDGMTSDMLRGCNGDQWREILGGASMKHVHTEGGEGKKVTFCNKQ